MTRSLVRLSRVLKSASRIVSSEYFLYLMESYTRHTCLVACIIIVLALSIDLTFFLTKVVAEISHWSVFWPGYFVLYLGLRATDFLTELLPLIIFGGVLWAEVAHSQSRERLVVWLSGRTVLNCMVPALVFGILVGVGDLALNVYLRPLAVMRLSTDHLGFFGEHFDPRPNSDPQWFAVERDLVQAIVVPGEPPILHDVSIYRMDATFALHAVLRAVTATPLAAHSWRLSEGTQWLANDAGTSSDERQHDFLRPEAGEAFAQRDVELNLSPIWLNNFRVTPRYLPNHVFKMIEKIDSPETSELQTWAQTENLYGLFLRSHALACIRTFNIAVVIRS